MVRPRTRGRTPIAIILVLLGYICYLHWTESSITTSSSPVNSLADIQITTETKGWAKAGLPEISIYQRPLLPVPKEKMRVVVATMTTGQTTYDYISLSNKIGYVNKHNYAIKVDFALPKDFVPLPFWHKLDMFEYLVRTGDYDWIWWVDFDTVITNTTIKIEDIIADALRDEKNPDNIDLLLTSDCWPLNAGSMLLRATPRLLPFLSSVWKCGDAPKEPSEQDCIRDILNSSPQERSRAKWIAQKKMNSFPEEIGCYDSNNLPWSPGDFVIHFAGAWAHLKGKAKRDPYGVMMRKFHEWVDKTELSGTERYQVLGEGPDDKGRDENVVTVTVTETVSNSAPTAGA
ncbi:galactosyl transferase GMA12/MNN10 family-domain-containing protein [Tricharina praecox]|uniref:galactosyl transferase GMA12/MNN10 family-domain-containing protein n=1 Tax=Tricharina praecox TaxID=43433 RepID=UPI0022204118|nr:galactosyl transferase GMA12/MNN10 family-domain-containing protein [Tricharina praecox]KAI5847508.1 galactosyl transferase GMA12/MNN10 family-domain-containing protein [Tricharina praecox]